MIVGTRTLERIKIVGKYPIVFPLHTEIANKEINLNDNVDQLEVMENPKMEN